MQVWVYCTCQEVAGFPQLAQPGSPLCLTGAPSPFTLPVATSAGLPEFRVQTIMTISISTTANYRTPYYRSRIESSEAVQQISSKQPEPLKAARKLPCQGSYCDFCSQQKGECDDLIAHREYDHWGIYNLQWLVLTLSSHIYSIQHPWQVKVASQEGCGELQRCMPLI